VADSIAAGTERTLGPFNTGSGSTGRHIPVIAVAIDITGCFTRFPKNGSIGVPWGYSIGVVETVTDGAGERSFGDNADKWFPGRTGYAESDFNLVVTQQTVAEIVMTGLTFELHLVPVLGVSTRT
jgi:hypothetical protein